MTTDYVPPGGNYPFRGQIVQSGSDTINCPKNIIVSIPAARAIYLSYREAHVKRIALYAAIEGLIAGNPPYNPEELASHGLSHIANFNDLTARALYERAALSYWNLLYSAERIANFHIRGNFQEARKLADILSDNFDKVIKKWEPFTTVFNTLVAQIVKFGVSPVFWRDERDWRWDVIELQRFFVSQQASTNTDKLTCVCVESVFTAQYLYEVYNELKGKKWLPPSGTPMEKESDYAEDKDVVYSDEYSPWNLNCLEKLLLFYANQSVKDGSLIKDMMDLQQRIQEGNFIWDSVFSDGFRLVSLFYREYDGKISHYMFDRNFDNGEFLYFVDRQYTNFKEALLIFTASPGEFTIHSNRGVGQKIFPSAQALMQANCSMVDMMKMASTPFIKTLNIGGKEFEQIKVFPGVPTNIGSSEFVQTNFGANIQQLIGGSQYLLQLLNYNAANSGDDPGIPDRPAGSLSAPQARMQSFREFAIPKNNIQHFYSTFDLVLENVAIKMFHSEEGYPGYEYAKMWKEMCIADGVPPEIFETKGVEKNELPPGIELNATRVAGDGSTLAMITGLEALMPISGSFSEKGVKEFQRQWIRAIMGPDYVPAFIEEGKEVGEEVSLAAVENGIMRLGESPVVSPANEQQTHIVTHFALLNEIINLIKQQQMTPIDGDKIFSVAVPHTEEHIEIFSRSIFSKGFLDEILPSWNEIQRFAVANRALAAKMIQTEIRKRQEEAQQQQEVMSDAQRKDFVAQKDVERADFKVQNQVERAKQANENRAEVMREKVRKDAENEKLKIQLEAQTKGGGGGLSQKDQLSGMDTGSLRNTLTELSGERPAEFDFEEEA